MLKKLNAIEKSLAKLPTKPLKPVVDTSLCILFLFIFTLTSRAQSIDSLNAELGKALNDTTRINVFYDLSTEYYYLQEFDSAVGKAKLGLELIQEYIKKENAGGKYLLAKFNYLLGIIYSNQSYFPEAIEYFTKALTDYKELKYDKGIAGTLNRLGVIYSSQSDYPKALEYHFEALKKSEEHKIPRSIMDAYFNIGIVHFHLTEFTKSEEYILKALKIAEEEKFDDEIGNILNGVGMLYGEQKEYDKSLSYFKRALSIARELDDKIVESNMINNIAVVYEELGNNEMALNYFMQSLEIDKSLNNQLGLAIGMNNIGLLLMKMKNYGEALKYLNESLRISTEIETLDDIKNAHNSLHQLYEKMNQPAKALKHYKIYIQYRDSISNEENTKQNVRAEMNYEYEKKQQQKKLEQEKIDAIYEEGLKRQRIIIYAAVILSIILVVFSVVVVTNYRQKQKINKELDIRNKKLESAFKIIEEKKREITDSINYAFRIQQSFLPERDEIFSHLPQSFILFKPKDIVSGDFYFWTKRDSKVLIAAADCTGHGVPGAMMSILGTEKIGDAVNKSDNVADILEKVNKAIKKALRQSEKEQTSKDGMDIALCGLTFNDDESALLEYAGANRPLWIIKKEGSQIEEVKANKVALGGHTEYEQLFQKREISLEKGDTFYIFSDGYSDQFGGERGKKITTKKLKEILIRIKDHPMHEQEKFLDNFIEEWKISEEQVDDILIIGIRV